MRLETLVLLNPDNKLLAHKALAKIKELLSMPLPESYKEASERYDLLEKCFDFMEDLEYEYFSFGITWEEYYELYKEAKDLRQGPVLSCLSLTQRKGDKNSWSLRELGFGSNSDFHIWDRGLCFSKLCGFDTGDPDFADNLLQKLETGEYLSVVPSTFNMIPPISGNDLIPMYNGDKLEVIFQITDKGEFFCKTPVTLEDLYKECRRLIHLYQNT
jgi:hypothetical protein